MNNISFYIFALIAIILGVLIIKRVVTCLMRSVVIIILLAALVAAWFLLGDGKMPQFLT